MVWDFIIKVVSPIFINPLPFLLSFACTLSLLYIDVRIHELGHVSAILKYSPNAYFEIKQYGTYGVTLSPYYEQLYSQKAQRRDEVIDNAKAGIKYERMFAICLLPFAFIIAQIEQTQLTGICMLLVSLWIPFFQLFGSAKTDRKYIKHPDKFDYPPKNREWHHNLSDYIVLIAISFLITSSGYVMSYFLYTYHIISRVASL